MSQNTYSHKSPPTNNCCSTVSAQLKLYQAFIFSVPIFFTFILLFLFYLLYLRSRRADWSSLRMRTNRLTNNDNISRCELGLKKELREILPIIVFKESFSVKDTQCSVCLGDYQAEDKLQRIPVCGHTFHMDCIDLWLATHTTCPLCRLSLLTKSSPKPPHNSQAETSHRPDDAENCEEGSHQYCSQSCEDPPQLSQQMSSLDNREEIISETSCSTQERG